MHKFMHTDLKFSITFIHIHKLTIIVYVSICKLAIFCLFLLSEQKDARDKERSAIKAREAFDELDLNKDGL